MSIFRQRVARLLAALMSIGLVLGLAAPVSAQEISPDHIAMARKYVDLTDRGAIFEVALVETAIATMRQIVSQNPNLANQTDAAIKKSLDTYRTRKGDLMNQFARVYALNFTLDELSQIVGFYETPVGKKLSAANSTINDSLTAVMTVFRNNLSTEFFAAVRADLRSAGFNL